MNIKELPAIYSGLGWYWIRSGDLAVVRAECPDVNEENSLLGHVVYSSENFTVCDWCKNGSFDKMEEDPFDLVIFIGPDKPEQYNYYEWIKKQSIEPLYECWQFVSPTMRLVFDSLGELKAESDIFDYSKGRIIHLREVREPSMPDEFKTPSNEQLSEAAKKSIIPESYFDDDTELNQPLVEFDPKSQVTVEQLIKAEKTLREAGFTLRWDSFSPAEQTVEREPKLEPAAERKLMEVWTLGYEGKKRYCRTHETRELAELSSQLIDLPSRVVHLREVPEGEEVRCWARMGLGNFPVQITYLPKLVDRWRSDGFEVVECVGYRKAK